MQNDRTTCVNPATGEILGYSDLNTPQDVIEAVSKARSAQTQWADIPVSKRVRCLKQLKDYLTGHADELADTIARDNGKTRIDAMTSEVLPATMALNYYCRKARAFLKDRRLMPGSFLLANKMSKIIRAPYGVIGIISPWNYPFSIPFSEIIMALLAGNSVILKMASETQMVGRAMERCIKSADLPDGLFHYMNLPGRQAGEAFFNAGVDKLFFTGSVTVGKILMAQSAESLTPLVLELGGNDPMLVCPDANLERAAAGAVWAGLQNCGQTCGGVERIYVHKSIYESFLEELGWRVRQLRVGYDTDYCVDMGAMTTARQVEQVRRQVDAALEQGAKLFASSNTVDDKTNHFLPAMVLTNVNHSMDVMQQETFGPVVAVMPVSDMDEAVSLANDCDLGLTASVWTSRRKSGEQLGRRIKAGVVMINDHLMSHGLPETPWGGFKLTGIGRTHGNIGMTEMSQVQCMVHDYLPGVKRNMWWHPFGPDVYKGIKGILEMLYSRNIIRRIIGVQRFLMLFPRTFKASRKN
ncbi:MAG: aldehyde dehydrogenase family protein [Desulfobacteraceae bacterium]|nr:aldehyde dehydrogenase family protein [Desulfobacteraceae bacterium]